MKLNLDCNETEPATLAEVCLKKQVPQEWAPI